MTSLPVLVLVLGIGIVRSQSIGYWVLGAELGIVLTLLITVFTVLIVTFTAMCVLLVFTAEEGQSGVGKPAGAGTRGSC